MPKRTRVEMDIDNVDSMFNLLLNTCSAVDKFSDPQSFSFLAALKKQVLSDLSTKEVTKAATNFTLEGAIEMFGLKDDGTPSQPRYWRIEEEVGEKEFPLTPCIESLLDNYHKNFDRSSEATCRTAVDFMLNECLTVMKGNEDTADRDARLKTPSPLNDIKIYGEVSFTHKVSPAVPSTVVTGRVDYGIGRVLNTRFQDAADRRRRCFYSLLLLVEAKYELNFAYALAQLVVYLGSLHQSRLQRLRPDATVYGLATDGYFFQFVKITHDGTLLQSKIFNILFGDMKKILACLRHILEETASRSPKSAPDRNWDDDEADESDPLMDVDDRKSMIPPFGEEDEEDEV